MKNIRYILFIILLIINLLSYTQTITIYSLSGNVQKSTLTYNYQVQSHFYGASGSCNVKYSFIYNGAILLETTKSYDNFYNGVLIDETFQNIPLFAVPHGESFSFKIELFQNNLSLTSLTNNITFTQPVLNDDFFLKMCHNPECIFPFSAQNDIKIGLDRKTICESSDCESSLPCTNSCADCPPHPSSIPAFSNSPLPLTWELFRYHPDIGFEKILFYPHQSNKILPADEYISIKDEINTLNNQNFYTYIIKCKFNIGAWTYKFEQPFHIFPSFDFKIKKNTDQSFSNRKVICSYVPQNGESIDFKTNIEFDINKLVSITWDFGDGSQPVVYTNQFQASHNYLSPGVYTATCTIQYQHPSFPNAPPLVCVASHPIYLHPEREFLFNPNPPVETGVVINFTNNGFDPIFGVKKYRIWIDGVLKPGNNSPNPHNYHLEFYNSGMHSANLDFIAVDDRNCKLKTQEFIITGLNNLNITNFSNTINFNNLKIDFNADFNFTIENYSPDNPEVEFVYQFYTVFDEYRLPILPSAVQFSIPVNSNNIYNSHIQRQIELCDIVPNHEVLFELIMNYKGRQIKKYQFSGTFINSNLNILQQLNLENINHTPFTNCGSNNITFNVIENLVNHDIVDYNWNLYKINNGQPQIIDNSNASIYNYIFTEPGNYKIKCFTKFNNNIGCDFYVEKNLIVYPELEIISNEIVYCDHTLPTGGFSLNYYPPNSSIVWDWNDNTPNQTVSTNSAIFHTYSQPANYTISASIYFDYNGNSSASCMATKKLTVLPKVPLNLSPLNPITNNPIQFKAVIPTQYQRLFGPLSMKIDLKENTNLPYTLCTNNLPNLYVLKCEKTYNSPVNVDAKLIYTTNSKVCESIESFHVCINPLNSTIISNTYNCDKIVHFKTTQQGANYVWNFGDPSTGNNNISTLQEPDHEFSQPGTYTVRLEVFDNSGLCTASDAKIVYIIPKINDEIIVPATGTVNNMINVTGDLSNANCNGYKIYWGDGAITESNNNQLNQTHIYTRAGEYIVLLTTKHGTTHPQPECTHPPKTIAICPQPVINGPDEVAPGSSIVLTATATGFSSSLGTMTYEWYIDGRGPYPGLSYTAVFNTSGEHTIDLHGTYRYTGGANITDKNFTCTNVATRKIYVFPTGNFVFNPDPVKIDIETQITLQTLPLWNKYSIKSWKFIFDDNTNPVIGTNDLLISTKHKYKKPKKSAKIRCEVTYKYKDNIPNANTFKVNYSSSFNICPWAEIIGPELNCPNSYASYTANLHTGGSAPGKGPIPLKWILPDNSVFIGPTLELLNTNNSGTIATNFLQLEYADPRFECTIFHKKDIRVLPNLDIIVNPIDMIFAGDEASFHIDPPYGITFNNAIFTFENGATQSITILNNTIHATHTFQTPGLYNIIADITLLENNTQKSSTCRFYKNIMICPKVNIQSEKDIVCNYESLQFAPLVLNLPQSCEPYTTQWWLNGNAYQGAGNPTFTFINNPKLGAGDPGYSINNNVKLKVYFACGCNITTEKNIIVLPSLNFDHAVVPDPTGGYAGTQIEFKHMVPYNCNPESWTLDYGNGQGNSGGALNPNQILKDYYTYTQNGNYTTKLTIKYDDNTFCSAQKNLEINIPVIYCTDCIDPFRPKAGEKYVLSAWIKQPLKTINTGIRISFPGTTTVIGPVGGTGSIIDGWQRIETTFIIPEGAAQFVLDLVNGSNNDIYFDDIRVQPANSMVKSYVYDPVTLRLMAELDENNYATYYEYDEEGNLIRIKKETERGIKTIQETHSHIRINKN